MRINKISGLYTSNVNFKNALSTKQTKKYVDLLNRIEERKGFQDGIRMVKLYGPALPSDDEHDCGMGKINSKQAERFYDIARVYYNANAVKFMPYGQLTDKQVYSDRRYTGTYVRSGLTIGEDVIDIAQLQDDKWGNILSRHDVQNFLKEHKKKELSANTIDFETTLGYKNQEDYPVNEYLKIAKLNFDYRPHASAELKKLRKEFKEFKKQKYPVDYDDIYTRLALFPYIKNPYTARLDFFQGYDSDPKIRAQKQPEYNALKAKYKDEIDFFKFKQFLAHKTVLDATQMLHDRNMKSLSDCAYGSSWPEVQCFPDAFIEGADTMYGLPVLNFYDLIEKDDSPAHRFLKSKVAHQFLHHDGTRFDLGWIYMRPSFKNNYGDFIKLDAQNKITDFIADVAKEIKSDSYDENLIMYECIADARDFSLHGEKRTLDSLKGLAMLNTEEEKNDERNIGWGNLAFYEYNVGLNKDQMILGTNNHDGLGVLNCAHSEEKSNEQVGGLMRVFNKIVPEGWRFFKDDNYFTSHLCKYIRARFSEVQCAKNRFILYTDLLGRRDCVDYHSGGVGEYSKIDYKNRLERNYEENFNRSLIGSTACNLADSEAFRIEMLEEDNPDYEDYLSAQKFAQYLKRDDGIYTQKDADKSSLGNIDIEKSGIYIAVSTKSAKT